jgi:hypothetical protein
MNEAGIDEPKDHFIDRRCRNSDPLCEINLPLAVLFPQFKKNKNLAAVKPDLTHVSLKRILISGADPREGIADRFLDLHKALSL